MADQNEDDVHVQSSPFQVYAAHQWVHGDVPPAHFCKEEEEVSAKLAELTQAFQNPLGFIQP